MPDEEQAIVAKARDLALEYASTAEAIGIGAIEITMSGSVCKGDPKWQSSQLSVNFRSLSNFKSAVSEPPVESGATILGRNAPSARKALAHGDQRLEVACVPAAGFMAKECPGAPPSGVLFLMRGQKGSARRARIEPEPTAGLETAGKHPTTPGSVQRHPPKPTEKPFPETTESDKGRSGAPAAFSCSWRMVRARSQSAHMGPYRGRCWCIYLLDTSTIRRARAQKAPL